MNLLDEFDQWVANFNSMFSACSYNPLKFSAQFTGSHDVWHIEKDGSLNNKELYQIKGDFNGKLLKNRFFF